MILLLLLVQDPVEEALKAISAENMKEFLGVLAGDEYEGRNSGQKGNEKAADYIIEKIKGWGLKPFGETKDGERDYRQHFEFGRGAAKIKTANIVSVIEGSDAKLKDEIIVVGAHMDHVGREGQPNAGQIGGAIEGDDIWNGADDNGSGTTCLLEVARAFATSKIKPKRTVIFMWFSAEEWGLLGSKYYCRHPSVDLKRHVAMVNLDMVGRNPGRPLDISAVGTSDDWAGIIEESAKGMKLDFKMTAGVTGGSDHASFAEVKIPAVHFFTDFHGDYHRVGDHADKIAYERMAEIGQMVLRLTAVLADREKAPAWRDDGAAKARGKTLGINGEPLDEEEAAKHGVTGGIYVDRVVEDSAAGKAGVREDDILIEFAGEKLPDAKRLMSRLRTLIRNTEYGVDVPVAVLRNKERVELKVRFEKE